MSARKTALLWGLWLSMGTMNAAAVLIAPMAQGFSGLQGDSPQSSRIVYFHVPVAIASFIAFIAAGIWAVKYLRRRQPGADHASRAAIEVGVVFCILATVTGAVWAQVQWGAAWNWDPRQTSIVMALAFYLAYLTLRGAIEDPEAQARISAAYATLGLIVAPFLFFVMPRMASFSLHPKPAAAEMASPILLLVLGSTAAFIALFFWIHNLRCRQLALEDDDPLLDPADALAKETA